MLLYAMWHLHLTEDYGVRHLGIVCQVFTHIHTIIINTSLGSMIWAKGRLCPYGNLFILKHNPKCNCAWVGPQIHHAQMGFEYGSDPSLLIPPHSCTIFFYSNGFEDDFDQSLLTPPYSTCCVTIPNHDHLFLTVLHGWRCVRDSHPEARDACSIAFTFVLYVILLKRYWSKWIVICSEYKIAILFQWESIILLSLTMFPCQFAFTGWWSLEGY